MSLHFRGNLLFLALAVVYHGGKCFDPNLALPETLTDEWGCAVNEGYFWCGSSSRCLPAEDNCEDGLGEAVSCQVEYKGLLWDLSHLRKSNQQDYSVKAVGLKDTEVNFNLCGNAVTPEDKCIETTGTAGEIMAAPAPGYARELSGSGCKRLGESIKDRSNFKIAVLDEMAPMKGISISYTGGNTCPAHALYDCDGDCHHSLQINVYCHNSNVELPEMEEIEIVQPCTYKLAMHSVYGCPVDCPADREGRVCSDRGMCRAKAAPPGSDDLYRASCLCEDGYGGSACEMLEAEATLRGGALGGVPKPKAGPSMPSWRDEMLYSFGVWALAASLLLLVWRYKVSIWRFWLGMTGRVNKSGHQVSCSPSTNQNSFEQMKPLTSKNYSSGY